MDSSYEEDARLSPIKSKKRKGRGSTTLPGIIKAESSGVQKIIHYNEFGQPIGEVQYPSYLGVLARTMVPIVYKDWHKVPKELKEKLWSCVESKPCKLVVGSLENIVAHGTMYERTGPQEVIHTVLLEKFNVRVSVDVAIVKDAPLPIPIPEEMTIVGEAIECQVAWPKKFILVNNEVQTSFLEVLLHFPSTKIDFSFASLVGNEGNSKNVDFEKKLESVHAFESLVEQFKYDEAINIPLEKDIFGEEISVQLQGVDMECICQMKELSITCIMLYISHFHQVLKASNLDRRFAFVNPYVVSGKCQTGGNSKSTLIARRLDDAKPEGTIGYY
ncbi:uncharacterized protein LOC114295933 [Camellia sinensis]|uniref:uncharacterized protein LOC114295933 n=1 Tax=Camellia sinensis TaxID=4442 RepID=UPI0010368F48|nr:uncharacterized protein LOC114295933 [Camellia sinensis]